MKITPIINSNSILNFLKLLTTATLWMPFTVLAVEPVSNNQIRDLMIKDTNSNLSCPCPYSKDNLGGQCGTESLYYKPGASKAYCYRIDISSEAVYFYRLQKMSGFYPDTQEEPASSSSKVTKDANKTTSASSSEVYFKNNVPSGNEDQSNSTASYFKNNVQKTTPSSRGSIYLPATSSPAGKS